MTTLYLCLALQDRELVQHTLEDHFYDVEAAVEFVCHIMAVSCDDTG